MADIQLNRFLRTVYKYGSFAAVLTVIFVISLNGVSFSEDKTVYGKVGKPLEINLPSLASTFSQWMVDSFPEDLLELNSIIRQDETVFHFRVKKSGTGVAVFKQNVTGGIGPLTQVRMYTVNIKIKGDDKPAETQNLNDGAVRPTNGTGIGTDTSTDSVLDAPDPATDIIYSDIIIMSPDKLLDKMLQGKRGFPASKNRMTPLGKKSSAAVDTRPSPVPFSIEFLRPKGSYLFNPTHIMPLPDTPPGKEGFVPEYNQALMLVTRGLYDEALDAMKPLLVNKEDKSQLDIFYDYVNAHILLSAKRYEDAIPEFDKLINEKTFAEAARFYSAFAKDSAGNDTDASISGYEAVIAHHPKGFYTPEASYRIARIYLKEKAFDVAIKDLLRYVNYYPRQYPRSHKAAFIDDALYDLATIYDQVYEHQDFDKALKLYDRILNKYTASPYHDTVVERKKHIKSNYF